MRQHARDLEGTVAPAPGPWDIHPEGARVEFVARYLEVGRLRGRFRGVTGHMVVAERPEDSRLEVAIAAASIDTGIRLLDRVLRTGPFLNVRRHPWLRFRSREVARTGQTNLRVTGDLTVRTVTRPVTLDVDYRGLAPGAGAARARFAARAEVDRVAFGFGWSHILGVPLSGRGVRVELEVEAWPGEGPS
ncbi:MAG: YceI family protein [Actinomycetota bacterium]